MLIGISAGEDNLQIDGQSEPQQEAHTTKIYKCTLSGN